MRKISLPNVRYEIMPVSREGKILLPRGISDIPKGAVFSVTCSERTGIQGTIITARRIKEKGYAVVPHIPARMVRNKEHLRRIVSELDDMGVKDIFVLGGDATPARGSYSSALELLRDLYNIPHAIEQVGITGYPQGHHAISDEVLAGALHAKQVYADYVVTQICCSTKALLSWLQNIRTAGVELPVYVGIVGKVSRKRMLSIAKHFGFQKSMWFGARNPHIALGMVLPGGYSAKRVVLRAADIKSVKGFHLNTFNSLVETEKWRKALAGTPSLQ